MPIILSITLVLITAGAHGAPEPERGSKSSGAEISKKHNKGDTIQPDTDRLSAAINKLTAEISQAQAKAANDLKEAKQQIERDLLKADNKIADETQRLADQTETIAGLTKLIVFVATLQLFLFGWQLKLMNKATNDAGKAANAADLSARSAVALQSPYIVFSYAHLYVMTGQNASKYLHGGIPAEESNLMIGFQNRGGGAAYPEQFIYDWAVLEQLPATIVYSKELNFEAGASLPVMGQLNPDLRGKMIFTDEELAAIGNQTKRLWLWGKFSFSDYMGDWHEFSFVLYWHPDLPRREEEISPRSVGWVEYKDNHAYSYRKHIPKKM